jgi:glycosyltransferase involved in cell wall biosynthesis
VFEGYGKLIRCDHIDVDPNYAREMPCPSSDHLAEILDELYQDRELLEEVAYQCYERVTQEQFKWEVIANQFDEEFQGVLNPPEESAEVCDEVKEPVAI